MANTALGELVRRMGAAIRKDQADNAWVANRLCHAARVARPGQHAGGYSGDNLYVSTAWYAAVWEHYFRLRDQGLVGEMARERHGALAPVINRRGQTGGLTLFGYRLFLDDELDPGDSYVASSRRPSSRRRP